MRENHTLLLRSATFSNFEKPPSQACFQVHRSPFPLWLFGMGVWRKPFFGHKNGFLRFRLPPTPSPRHFPNCKNSPLAHPLSPYGFLGWGCGGNRSLATKNGFPHFRLPLPSPASVSRLSSSSSASPFCVFCACVVYCNRGGEKDANCTCYRRLPGNRRSHRA